MKSGAWRSDSRVQRRSSGWLSDCKEGPAQAGRSFSQTKNLGAGAEERVPFSKVVVQRVQSSEDLVFADDQQLKTGDYAFLSLRLSQIKNTAPMIATTISEIRPPEANKPNR
jgi:hypothetical protein